MKKYCLILMALIVMAVIPAEANRMGFVLCKPESTVNLRFEPSKNGTVIANLLCGDELTLDGKTHGEWLHVVTGDEKGAWIHKGYVVGVRVTVGTFEAKTTAKVRTRNKVGGRLTGTLRKGQKVIVYAWSEECCYTNKGYVAGKYITKQQEETPYENEENRNHERENSSSVPQL